jgi:hypothetical protein
VLLHATTNMPLRSSRSYVLRATCTARARARQEAYTVQHASLSRIGATAGSQQLPSSVTATLVCNGREAKLARKARVNNAVTAVQYS